jgi:hypothetical protein
MHVRLVSPQSVSWLIPRSLRGDGTNGAFPQGSDAVTPAPRASFRSAPLDSGGPSQEGAGHATIESTADAEPKRALPLWAE